MEYRAYLLQIEHSDEIPIGSFSKLSPALRAAKAACIKKGIREWDWIVDKHDDGILINRRSSIAGLES